MPERKRKKGIFDLFDFGGEDTVGGGGSGYSISVTHDEMGKPLVRVKTHGDVDVAELRRDIEERYPEARIEGLQKKPLIRVIDEEEENSSKNE